MRESAFILLNTQPPDEPGQEEWEHEEQLAAEGKWDELGIDAPPDMQPATVEEFMSNG